ncbi:MAG TPA: FliI/YscN family ATPase [Steroidobacteraceae bacterium]|nr:FliI/YscN family ATPase [Steroidobacteraceae bacterium]
MHDLARAIAGTELVARTGRVVAVRGSIVESTGPAAQIGEQCRIEGAARGESIAAEVVGFTNGVTVLMPVGSVEGISVGERVVALGRLPEIRVGDELLGRVVDAFGRPLDEGAAFTAGRSRGLRAQPLSVLRRQRVDTALDTGVRVIDSMLTLARGQRIGLFAGSGVGKSSLMGMMARGAQAGVNVIALIGERSREVREFIEDQLGSEGLQRSVVVVATAAEPAVVRIKAAYAATTIAEYFRDQGQDVLLMMDSLTRFAMARREIGLAVGEPPTARGYTPSVFAELPQLCERSGPGVGAGSITGVYTVLVDGDDMNEPVADTLRGTLDGHIVLSREIANAGQYPAVDVLNSVSRVHTSVGKPEDLAAARRVLACCALYERNRQLIEVGAYKQGVSPSLDRAVQLMPRIRAFLSQPLGHKTPRAESLAQLRKLAASLGADHEIA